MGDPLSVSPRVKSIATALSAFRRLKPSTVVAIDVVGDETPIKITGQRGRYERVARGLIGMNAVSCRLLDSAGQVLEVLTLRAPEEPTELEAPPASLVPSASAELVATKRADEVRELVKIALDAADRMRARDLEYLEKITTAAVRTMEAAGTRAEALDRLLAEHTAHERRELRRYAAQLEANAANHVDSEQSELDKTIAGLLEKGFNGVMPNGSPKQ